MCSGATGRLIVGSWLATASAAEKLSVARAQSWAPVWCSKCHPGHLQRALTVRGSGGLPESFGGISAVSTLSRPSPPLFDARSPPRTQFDGEQLRHSICGQPGSPPGNLSSALF